MITYSKSFLDFLENSSSRIAYILFHAHYGYPAYRLFVTNKEIDYITFRHDGSISYLPSGKEHKVNDDGSWKRDGRQNGKPGKIIRKLFTKNALKVINSKEFEMFANHYKAECNKDGYRFEVWPNKKIPGVYDMDTENRSENSLNNSCMNGESGYMDIYKYCKQLSIVVLLNNDGRLCGRALVWKTSDTLTIMDRIYCTQEFMYEMFVEYANTQGWYHKKHYKTSDYKTDFISPDDTEVELKIRIVTDCNFDRYPYIDTFSYGDYDSLNNYGDGPFEYNCTDGAREGDDDNDNRAYDDIDEEYIDEDDAVYIDRGERQGQYTHIDNTVEVNGRTYWRRDSCLVVINGEYHHQDDVVYSERDGEDYLSNDCVWSEHEASYILRDDAVEIDDEWYHKDNLPESEEIENE